MSKNEESLKKAQKDLDILLREHDVNLGYEIGFPIYKILPDEVKLALNILKKHGMQVSITLEKK